MSFNLTWIPHWDILDIGWISLHRNTKASRLFLPQLNSNKHKIFLFLCILVALDLHDQFKL